MEDFNHSSADSSSLVALDKICTTQTDNKRVNINVEGYEIVLGKTVLLKKPHLPCTSGKFVRYLNSLMHLTMFKVDKVNFVLELHLKLCYCK
jgi:hypothetical protein